MTLPAAQGHLKSTVQQTVNHIVETH